MVMVRCSAVDHTLRVYSQVVACTAGHVINHTPHRASVATRRHQTPGLSRHHSSRRRLGLMEQLVSADVQWLGEERCQQTEYDNRQADDTPFLCFHILIHT